MNKIKTSKIFENIWLKLLALFAAFTMWFIVMNIQDSIITRTISDIDVEMLNGEVIYESGYLYNVTNGEEVSVVVKGPRSVIENLEPENFTATADLSQLSVTNSTTIDVVINSSVSASDASNISITPINKYVTLSIEEEMEKSIPVKVITTGSVKGGYQLGNPVPTPNMITVSGPESVLDTIVEARAVVNLTGNEETEIVQSVSIGCTDGYGSAVDKDNITLSTSNASVSIPVYNTKEVPVNVMTAGNVASGFGVREVNFEPSFVIVAGDEETLAAFESVQIKDILITDATENIEKNVDVSDYLPDGLFLADSSDKEIAVNVSVEATSEREINMPVSNIVIDNKSEDYEYTIPANEYTKIKISGFDEDIENVTIDELNPHVDVKDLGKGDHARQITFTEGEKFKINGTYSVVVKITDKKVEEDEKPE